VKPFKTFSAFRARIQLLSCSIKSTSSRHFESYSLAALRRAPDTKALPTPGGAKFHPSPTFNRLQKRQGKFLERHSVVKERREIERSSISHWRPRATSAFAAIELHVLSLYLSRSSSSSSGEDGLEAVCV
jgi:hypothetical protein